LAFRKDHDTVGVLTGCFSAGQNFGSAKDVFVMATQVLVASTLLLAVLKRVEHFSARPIARSLAARRSSQSDNVQAVEPIRAAS
jgi:hypothetical protein